MSRVLCTLALLLPACVFQFDVDDGKSGGAASEDSAGDSSLLGDSGDDPIDADDDGTPQTDDCDDTDPNVNPDATEVCDGIDNNCDAQIDEGVLDVFNVDADGDGFGDPDSTGAGCPGTDGLVSNDEDCDDSTADTNPDAVEVCDETDNNCDGAIDEGVLHTFYGDVDADGFGDVNVPALACDPPDHYSKNSGDCNDAEALSYPGNAEVCDGIDNNCDGATDEDVEGVFYPDGDLDGFGDPLWPVAGCELPAGYVADNTDCDDTTDRSSPTGTETCDEIDNNCDGAVDEGLTTTYYEDFDGDGFGNPDVSMESCTMPAGYCLDNTDCDDADILVSTGC